MGMNAANIRRACEANGMRPVCDHKAYRDAYCYSSGRNLHFSYPSHDRALGVQVSKVRGAFFYTGRHGRGSLMNTGSTHRWMNNNDRNKDTFCEGYRPILRYKGRKFYRIRVSGVMNAATIRQACNARGLKPVCDYNGYRDATCYASGRNLHFSYPPHDRQLGVSVSKMKGAFFYTGRHGRGSLMNTGTSHRWMNNNDRNKDTFCEGNISLK